MTTHRLPSLGCYNGHFVHPRIAVGGVVRPEHIDDFAAAGIRGIVDVSAVAVRHQLLYVSALPETIHWRLLGIWDGIYSDPESPEGRSHAHTSVDPEYAEFMVREMAAVVRDHSPVLFHCVGGVGRSGNLAAVALAAIENTTVDKALDEMQSYRPQLSRWGRHLWKHCDPGRLVALAGEVLNSPAEPRSTSR
jgi:protein-tyrosine phosphatase